VGDGTFTFRFAPLSVVVGLPQHCKTFEVGNALSHKLGAGNGI